MAQSGVDALVYGPLHGNPTPVNIVLAASGTIVSLALTAFVAVNGRAFAKEKASYEAESENQRLLSDNANGYGTN